MTTDSFHGYQEYPQPYSIMNLLPSSGATTIVQLPLAFVRSGGVALNNGTTSNVGFYGYGWARTAFSSSYAYYLDFYTTRVNPSSYSYRYLGRSLRCLYPGSDVHHSTKPYIFKHVIYLCKQ